MFVLNIYVTSSLPSCFNKNTTQKTKNYRLFTVLMECLSSAVVDLHSKILDVPPPWGPNSFNFMQFLGNIGKIVCWCLPGELVPPPQGNPGSATGQETNYLFKNI